MTGPGRLPPEMLRRRLAELGDWFHNIELDGIQTAPDHFLHDYPAVKWRSFAHAIPADLHGKSVLDVGCNGGFYALEMKRRGADRVLGIDSDDRYLAQARFAAEVTGLAIEFRNLSVYDVAALGEKFDIVLFMGVLYHLRHPLLALDLIHDHVARDMLVFQSMLRGAATVAPLADDYDFETTDIFEQGGFPQLHFIEKNYAHDPTNWWVPNRACVEAMLRAAGFAIVGRPEREVYICRHVGATGGAVYPVKERGHDEAAMIWNEPNNKSHWDPEIDPDWSRFAAMARLAGQAIHAENPRLPRVLGGISPIDAGFMRRMQVAGVLDVVEAVAVHGFPLDWNLWQIDEWPAKLDEIRAVTDKPVWVSEVGVSSFGAEEVQAWGVDRTAQMLTGRVPRIHWYSLYDLPKAWEATTRHREAEGSSYYRHFYMGLLREDGTPKPSAERFARHTPELGVCQWFNYEDHRLLDAVAWMKRLGVTYLRTGLSWADVFRPDAREWFDRQMAALAAFSVTVTFCFTPEHRGIAPHHTSAPLVPEEFAAFCAEMDPPLRAWMSDFSDTMRAAVLVGPGRVQVVRVARPRPGPGQILLRLEGCGVCASNLVPWSGPDWMRFPTEPGDLGHEGWGTVAALGEGVSGVAVGDRVAALSFRSYAEYDLAEADAVLCLPAALAGEPFMGEPLGCAINTFRRSAIEPGQTIAIVGVGFLGALLTQLARAAGARVIAISRREFALSVARDMGADETVACDDHSGVIELVKTLTAEISANG